MSIEKTGTNVGHEAEQLYRKELENIPEEHKKTIDRAMGSPFWDEELPGVKGWTVGNLILQLIEDGKYDRFKHNPEQLYREYEEINQKKDKE